MEALIQSNVGIKSIKFNGYKVELSTNIKGKSVAKLSRFMTMGKNKGTFKTIECYYFATDLRRQEWITKRMEDIKANLSAKDEAKNKRKDARENYVNTFKIGEVYYDSWGYDQTNIDFYMITEVKEKSVMVQRIGAIMCKGGRESGMSSNVKPDITNKIGEPEIKIIQIRVWDNKVVSFIKSRHGWISKYDAGDKGVYSSWYA